MKNTYTFICSILMLLATTSTFSQGISDVYTFTIRHSSVQPTTMSRPKMLNGYNKNAYNNQPYFLNDKSLMLTSQIKGEAQTDIYTLNIYERTKTQVTRTPEAEYSPRLRPGKNAFNCVRVESDGVTQRLWEFPTDHSTQGKPLFPDVKTVGYYHWLSRTQVALFLVGEPHSLAIGDASTEEITTITSNIGRGMQSTADGMLLYVQKLSESTWYIKKLDPNTGKSTIVVETLDGSEDFVMLNNTTLLMAKGARIFTYEMNVDKEWKEVADLAKYGLKNITRLAFNGDRILAVVDSVK